MRFFKTTGQPLIIHMETIFREMWVDELQLHLPLKYHCIQGSTLLFHDMGYPHQQIAYFRQEWYVKKTLFNILLGSWCISRLVILQFNWNICGFAIHSFQLNNIYACYIRMSHFINASTHICILLYCFWYVKHIAGLKSVVSCSFGMWHISQVMLIKDAMYLIFGLSFFWSV